MAHPLGILGLALNMAGSIALLWFPPKVSDYTPEGLQVVGGWSELPRDAAEAKRNKRSHRLRTNAFRLGVLLLVVGFALQLFDLLRG